MNWQAAGISDSGPFRDHNEDRFLLDADLKLAIVADGVGGLGQGDLAAELVCKSVQRQLQRGHRLPQATVYAHHLIEQKAARQPGGKMAATVVGLQLSGESGQLVWAGDSRCYRFRGEALEALTEDHSFVQGLLKAGAISEEEARSHPQRNVVTRALGQKLDKLSCRNIIARAGDRYLLCSDGVCGTLDENSLKVVLEAYDDPEHCAQALVDTALGAGSRDNLTAVVVDVEPES